MNVNPTPLAFDPLGLQSHYIQAVASPSAPNAVRPSSGGARINVRIVVGAGSAVVSIGWSTVDAATAVANSVLPTAGTPQQCIVMQPGSVEVFTLPDGAYFSARSASNADVFITAGAGV